MYGLFSKSREIPNGVNIIGEYFDENHMLGKYDPKDTHYSILFRASVVWDNSYVVAKNRYSDSIGHVDDNFKEFVLKEYPEWAV